MEKFFTIKKESELYKDYFQYLDDYKRNAEIFNEFADKHNIEASRFIPYKKYLLIVPTERDKDKFREDFTQEYGDGGLRQFKVRSEVGKAWTATMSDIRPAHKPTYFGLVHVYGHFTERLFNIGDVLYGSISANGSFELHSCMEEIKASEFYKIIEDYNSEHSNS
ncbi:hypothetical protein [Anaerocolumna chitinilytica]|uniref:Uncharacterized protein n=1 Tax=Anaerocolumna chitinilytica TaxID=1727145 RepID=A0A7M3SAL9_9FIRM|nr:hypothetical protein [Anaerocolumna chitinilytica]BCK01637.1 hypothetical protein bsdcttw_46770 [Anaerocolumna chitinilytica]